MKETINDFKFELDLKVCCREGEEEEVKKRLLNLIIGSTEREEGLFQTSILPWKKSYYFSVREVKGVAK